MSRTITNGAYTATELVTKARELDVPGQLIRRGRKNETRGYPVRLESGSILIWMVCASADQHYTGRA